MMPRALPQLICRDEDGAASEAASASVVAVVGPGLAWPKAVLSVNPIDLYVLSFFGLLGLTFREGFDHDRDWDSGWDSDWGQGCCRLPNINHWGPAAAAALEAFVMCLNSYANPARCNPIPFSLLLLSPS